MSKANMPVTNTGSKRVKLGTTKGSAIMASSTGNSVAPASQGKGSRANMPTHNNGQTRVPNGTRKYGVGETPSY